MNETVKKQVAHLKVICLLTLLWVLHLPSKSISQEKTSEELSTEMNYGPAMAMTVEAPWPPENTTLKGVTVDLKSHSLPQAGMLPTSSGQFL